MANIEAPDIESFKPIGTYQALGLGFVALENGDGVRLDMSQAGVEQTDQDPDLSPLLTRMGVRIGEHGHYRATIDVPGAERGRIMKVGEPKSKMKKLGYRTGDLASVYHHDSAPGAVIKAYDHAYMSAGFQFYLGAWLHNSLAKADDGLSSAAQFAWLRAARFGHRTVVMDYVPGKNLSDVAVSLGTDENYRQQISEIDQIAFQTGKAAKKKLARSLGWRGTLIANDLKNIRNLFVSDPEAVTPDNLLDQELTIIDQPYSPKYKLPGLVLARYLPTPRPARQPEPALASSKL